MKLKDMRYVIGDNFSFKGSISSGGSETLKGYVPIFNATVIEKLNQAGAKLAHVTSVKEFEVDIKQTSLSALSISENEADFGIGTDFNGILRKSATEANIVGFKPTYGLISRFGMYAVASTLDTVGIYGSDVKTCAIVADELKGLDEKDMNTWDSSKIDLVNNLENEISPKLFYLDNFAKIQSFTKNNLYDKYQIKAESIPSFKGMNMGIIFDIHNCIMSAEMTTTLANLTGIPFGNTGKGKNIDEMMVDFRSNFTPVVKKHLMVGCYSLLKENLDKYYYNSLRLRGLLFEELNKLFEKYDALITGNTGGDQLIANLCGYPSITVNGLLITGRQKDDAKILAIANAIEKGKILND